MAPHGAQREQRACAAAELERRHPPRLVDHRQAEHAEGSERRREYKKHHLGQAKPSHESSVVVHGGMVAGRQDSPRPQARLSPGGAP